MIEVSDVTKLVKICNHRVRISTFKSIQIWNAALKAYRTLELEMPHCICRSSCVITGNYLFVSDNFIRTRALL